MFLSVLFQMANGFYNMSKVYKIERNNCNKVVNALGNTTPLKCLKLGPFLNYNGISMTEVLIS